MASEITATVGMRVDVVAVLNGHINSGTYTKVSGPGDVIADSSGESFICLNDGDGPGDTVVHASLNVDKASTPEVEANLEADFTVHWVAKDINPATTLDFAPMVEVPA